MTSREQFFEVANSLTDVYPDFARCLYSEAYDEGLLDEIYSFMANNPSCTTDEVLLRLDDLLGNPCTVVGIVQEKRNSHLAVAG